MKSLSYRLFPAMVLGFGLCAAEVASGQSSLTLQVTDSTNAVWDLSEIPQLQHTTFDIEKNPGPGTEVEFDSPFVQTGGGKLKGGGTNDLSVSYRKEVTGPWIDLDPFPAAYKVNGSFTSTRGKGVLTFSSSAQGKAFMESRVRTLSAAVNYTIRMNSVSGTVSGRSSRRATAAGIGTLTDQGTFGPEAFSQELGDGSWTLAINLNPPSGNNRLSGQGTVTLETGAIYPFKITGLYTPKTQTSKLLLNGVDAGKGSVLQVTAVNGDVKRVTGLVSGQGVKVIR